MGYRLKQIIWICTSGIPKETSREERSKSKNSWLTQDEIRRTTDKSIVSSEWLFRTLVSSCGTCWRFRWSLAMHKKTETRVNQNRTCTWRQEKVLIVLWIFYEHRRIENCGSTCSFFSRYCTFGVLLMATVVLAGNSCIDDLSDVCPLVISQGNKPTAGTGCRAYI